MQYKVPQNIDMEDKIIGPFTMKQFVYLLIPGGIIYGWYSELAQNYDNFMVEFLVVAIPVGIIGVCFALVKINDRPFEFFALSLIRFMISPKQRKWVSGYAPENVILLDKAEAPKPETHLKDEGDLDDLSKALDQSSAEIRAKSEPVKIAKPRAKENEPSETVLNLSVKDVKAAAEKQNQAQSTPKSTGGTQNSVAAQKKKFMGLF
ncbi:MAG: PrgI family protein [Candidatus Berkelbacteria bacterium]|nr:PrgI family protein [Candidatus Berkelbacteria bacterium]